MSDHPVHITIIATIQCRKAGAIGVYYDEEFMLKFEDERGVPLRGTLPSRLAIFNEWNRVHAHEWDYFCIVDYRLAREGEEA